MIVKNGKLVYKKDGKLVNTDERSKWIFVLSTTRALYVGRKQKGRFQHSSFLSGGATTAAGRLVAHEGDLEVQYIQHCIITQHNHNNQTKVIVIIIKRCCMHNNAGYLAIQWSLSPNRREFQGIFKLSGGAQRRPHQCKGKCLVLSKIAN